MCFDSRPERATTTRQSFFSACHVLRRGRCRLTFVRTSLRLQSTVYILQWLFVNLLLLHFFYFSLFLITLFIIDIIFENYLFQILYLYITIFFSFLLSFISIFLMSIYLLQQDVNSKFPFITLMQQYFTIRFFRNEFSLYNFIQKKKILLQPRQRARGPLHHGFFLQTRCIIWRISLFVDKSYMHDSFYINGHTQHSQQQYLVHNIRRWI